MGLFKKNPSQKDYLKRAIAASLSSCGSCRYYDKYRAVCLNRNSGVTYTNAQQPRCSKWQLG